MAGGSARRAAKWSARPPGRAARWFRSPRIRQENGHYRRPARGRTASSPPSPRRSLSPRSRLSPRPRRQSQDPERPTGTGEEFHRRPRRSERHSELAGDLERRRRASGPASFDRAYRRHQAVAVTETAKAEIDQGLGARRGRRVDRLSPEATPTLTTTSASKLRSKRAGRGSCARVRRWRSRPLLCRSRNERPCP